MGCFCHETVQAILEAQLQASATAAATATVSASFSASLSASLTASVAGAFRASPEYALIEAIGAWLAMRGLPAPPWTPPDLVWLQYAPPSPPMLPQQLGTLVALVQAAATCQAALGLNLAMPSDVTQLSRLILTLNRRLPSFAAAENITENLAWSAVAQINAQIDLVQKALTLNLFAPAVAIEIAPQPSIALWQPLIEQIAQLSPLLVIAQLLGIDLQQHDAPALIAAQIRVLLAVDLPAVQDPMTLGLMINRFSAIARLQLSFGVDPRVYGLARVQAAVQRKAVALMQTLPLSIQATGIAALPTLPFNPGMALTSAILNLVRGIPLQTLGQLQWNVPDRNGLALLTAEPVLTLTTLLTGMGSNPVRLSPCGQHCDARAALAALT